jgi:hypothetical protein
MRTPLLLALALTTAAAQLPSGGRIIIITPDAFTAAVRPLADWHTRTGLLVRVVPLSVCGRTPDAVRAYIRQAWQDWPVRPEYVLIAAAPESLIGSQYCDDTYYGDMTGDYRMELPVGRLPARTSAECEVMAAKTITYDQARSDPDSLWYWQGTTCVSDDSQGGGPDPYYLPDSRHAHRLWLDAGYTHIDSLYNLAGSTYEELLDAFNAGRSFITYRGVAGGTWWVPFYQFWPGDEWQNGLRMPVIVAATCATVSLAPHEEMLGNASVRHGTLAGLGGAVAYFGTTLSDFRLSEYRSAAYRGFFDAIFTGSSDDLGRATVDARLAVDTAFHDYLRYIEWCLMGDPALRVRTAPPRTVVARFPAAVNTGVQSFAVRCSAGGAPLPDAIVCLWQDSTVYTVDTTDAAGSAALSINPTAPGELQVTVTARNARPFLGVSRVQHRGGAWLSYLKHALADSPPAGNGDGWAGPGETVAVPLWVANDGDSIARSTRVTLRCADPLITLLDSAIAFGDIPAHDSGSTGAPGFRFHLSDQVEDGRGIDFGLVIAANGAEWPGGFRVTAGAPVLEFPGWFVRDTAGNGDGILDPGETADIAVRLRNGGRGTGTGIQLRLRARDSRLALLDSTATLPDLPPGSSRLPVDGFRVALTGAIVPGTVIPCTVAAAVTGSAAEWPVDIHAGTIRSGDPQNDGRYWAYEDCDTAYPDHPAYDWVEARDRGRRLNLSLTHRNDTVEIPAGFGPFVFHGTDYRDLTIGFQGVVVPGSRPYTNASNVRLPRGAGPALLAPYWDGTNPDSTNAVWFWHDTAGRRIVVEWDSAYVLSNRTRETWQLIIHDSTSAARDGNSVFIYQYQSSGLHTGTVGIQDPSGLIGMTIQHDTFPDPSSGGVTAGRVIKFTTDEPYPGIADAATSGPGPIGITAFPNPASQRVSVSTGWFDRPATLGLYDPAGRLRLSLWLTEPRTLTLDLGDLCAGVYFLRLRAGAAAASTKLIVQH